MFPNLFELIPSKQENAVPFHAQEETHVTFPAIRIVPCQHGDASGNGAFKGYTPFQPGTGQC